MARARMLSPMISTDSRVRKLPCPCAKLLFTWMIAHADNVGRMRGEAAYVRAAVIPHEPKVSDKDVASWLSEMVALGLITWYSVDGGSYIQLSSWEKHQRLDRMKSSAFPAPPATTGNQRLPEVEVEVEVEVEGKDLVRPGSNARSQSTPEATPEAAPKKKRPRTNPEAEHPDFAAWYAAYPRHTARRKASQAYQAAIKRGASPEALLAGAKAYSGLPDREPRFTKHPATWLNQDCWLDEQPEPEPTPEYYKPFFPDGRSKARES